MQKVEDLENTNLLYWDNFYKKHINDSESPFCKYVRSKIGAEYYVIDLGCGNGRDTFSFYKNGYHAIGIDRSHVAISTNKLKVMEEKLSEQRIEFKCVDISDEATFLRELQSIVKLARKIEKNVAVYNRFLLHSIDDMTEKVLMTSIAKVLEKGDLFLSEFRTLEDINNKKIYNGHYRRYIDSEKLALDLCERYDFHIIEFKEGYGFSLYKGENPYLARIIAEKL